MASNPSSKSFAKERAGFALNQIYDINSIDMGHVQSMGYDSDYAFLVDGINEYGDCTKSQNECLEALIYSDFKFEIRISISLLELQRSTSRKFFEKNAKISLFFAFFEKNAKNNN